VIPGPGESSGSRPSSRIPAERISVTVPGSPILAVTGEPDVSRTRSAISSPEFPAGFSADSITVAGSTRASDASGPSVPACGPASRASRSWLNRWPAPVKSRARQSPGPAARL
jgi:hypothetical protein